MSSFAVRPTSASAPAPRAGVREAVTQEVSVRRTEDGGQIVVRRLVAGEAGARRTLHIDAVVR